MVIAVVGYCFNCENYISVFTVLLFHYFPIVALITLRYKLQLLL
ncbi:hypothetical protein SAMN05444355_104275 [Flavobacterium frigoris]|uniref:Uncharacterized protein n=1 Tax=Flavobacterium frigoris TaxID=229204 RepID=A0A1H9JBQ1_FLAFI|nr:hypothetical protein SAMN05444355_104275 [Flavobacterium frigoris]